MFLNLFMCNYHYQRAESIGYTRNRLSGNSTQQLSLARIRNWSDTPFSNHWASCGIKVWNSYVFEKFTPVVSVLPAVNIFFQNLRLSSVEYGNS